jgi:hypothetical protein
MTQIAGPEDVALKTIDENERDHILKILKLCGGKLWGMAELRKYSAYHPAHFIQN